MIVVLFSGGIDSWGCLLWAIQKFGKDNVLPMYVDFGQVYAPIEKHVVRNLCNLVGLKAMFLSMSGMLIEDTSNGHIPLRNTFLLMLSASIESINGVVFGMLLGETCEDKNLSYISIMQKLFDSQFEKSIYRNETRRFKIYTPFASSTKAEVVAWIKDNPLNLPINGLGITMACFSGNKTMPCGNCISCFNRWVALELNGEFEPAYDTNHPFNYMLQKISPKFARENSGTPLLSIFNIWRKRHWIYDSYRAMNRYCKDVFGHSLRKHLLS